MSGSPPEKAEAVTHIRAVTFDVGGTLIAPWPSVGHVYAEVGAQHGLNNFSAAQLNERFKAAWRARRVFEHSRREWAELVHEVFELPPTPATNRFFDDLYQRFAEPYAWRIFEDVVPALNALTSRGIRLGVISNWDDRLRPLLRKLKLDKHFQSFSISCEAGFPKPSRVIFRHAAAELDLAPETILHVGDSWEMDVQGARDAGLRAVQIDRGALESNADAIQSLSELSGRIKSPGSRD